MWEEILKGRGASRTTQFIPSLKYGILKYVNENIPEGELIHLPSLARDPALEQIKTFAKEHFHITKGKKTGGIGGYLHHRAEGQIRNKGGIMLLNAGLVDLGGSASYKKYTRNSTMNDYTLNEISKAKDYGKVKPKKITPEMEEDIEEVVADNEFENNPTLSDKVKHVLMQGRKDSRPARTQEEMDEFKRRYPDVDKAEGGCGCGCSGEEVKKAKVPAVRNAQYNTYVKFIKKVLKDEGGAAGMQNFIDAGNKFKGFKERTLRYVISDAIDHDNWLAEHEFGDYYLYEGKA